MKEVAEVSSEFHARFSAKSRSYVYKIINGRPRNPVGRTGITGRGQLGKWGPNHAADPIVTRFVVYLLTNNLTQTQNLSKMSNQLKQMSNPFLVTI